MNDVDLPAIVRIDDPAFDQVLQFADVAGVIVFQQGVGRAPGKPVERAAMPFAVEAQEVRHQQGYVIAPFAQRRNGDGKDAEPEVEVAAEAPGRDLGCEIDV